MASVKKVDGSWVVRWRDGGRGSREHWVTCSTERRAHALAEEIEDQIERTGRYEPRRSGRASPVEVILTEYLADVARRRRPNTVRRYAQMLELWRRWVGQALADEALSYARLAEYHTHISSPATGRHLHRRAPETVRKHIESVELLWRWAWQRQARGDYHGVPQPDSLELERAAAPHKVAPTWDEMDACIDMADGWQHRLYLVLRSTGLRVGQALGLRWDDLRLDADVPTLTVRGELGKTKQERRGRVVPIAPVLVAELAGWGARDGWLLECGRAERVARARDADRAWARAGVDPAVWRGCGHHAFRAGFQSGLTALGASAEAVEHLVGHSRGDVRERYVGPGALPLLDAVRLVPPVCGRCVVPGSGAANLKLATRQ